MMQLDLPTDRPRLLELSGTEVLTVLPKLKADGAFVFRMDAIGMRRWRLFIAWPAIAPGSTQGRERPAALARVERNANAAIGRQVAPATRQGIFFNGAVEAGTESFHPIHGESQKTFVPPQG